jgi:uncharacterized damage-inducible protein DinB
MITAEYCRTMARYNAWQNRWIFAAADALAAEARDADRGLFWGSIRGTLSHLMWGDLAWMSRLDGGVGPAGQLHEAATAYDLAALMDGRPALDTRIRAWADGVAPADLDGALSWHSVAAGRTLSKPYSICVMHLFSHQIHHRGQVHAALTALGVRTEDTDLPFLPEDLPDWSSVPQAGALQDETNTTRRPAP